jgi:predicted branched-subunit amino acid permease
MSPTPPASPEPQPSEVDAPDAAPAAVGEIERTALGWFFAGQRQFFSLPAFILMMAFVGFGGLAQASGLTLAQTIFLVGFVWALPSAIVVVGAVQSGMSLVATMFAVALSAARLMPMTMSLIPVVRDDGTSRRVLYFLSHFVAITAWVFGMTTLPSLPRAGRAPFFAGFAVTLTCAGMAVGGASWIASAELPPLAAAALVLLTPLYFALSLWRAAVKAPTDRLALVFGAVVAPVMQTIAPSVDLLLTGLVGGGLALLGGRLLARRAEARAASVAADIIADLGPASEPRDVRGEGSR